MCDAGYYKDGNDCVMCTGNTVKLTMDEDTSCSTTCDGMTMVPNSGHTACGKKDNMYITR